MTQVQYDLYILKRRIQQLEADLDQARHEKHRWMELAIQGVALRERVMFELATGIVSKEPHETEAEVEAAQAVRKNEASQEAAAHEAGDS